MARTSIILLAEYKVMRALDVISVEARELAEYGLFQGQRSVSKFNIRQSLAVRVFFFFTS